VSLQQVARASLPRDEALYIAAMLAFTGGYLEAYAWIVHRVFANAQSAKLVAAFQTVSFPRAEGFSCDSVMVTSNFRQTIEGLFTAFPGNTDGRPFRRPYVFGAICIALVQVQPSAHLPRRYRVPTASPFP
jgi:uncharacterized membrane protein YoaK (UPF0700 family)